MLDTYKILDFMGDIGGLLDITMAIGVLITYSYVNQKYKRSLLGDTYQVQRYAKNNSEYYTSKSVRDCMTSLRKSLSHRRFNDHDEGDDKKLG